MSLGYAEKLSYKEDVGSVGMAENFDPPHLLQQKIEELAQLIKDCKHLVAFTGAGISTSCGIPDFRGPKGIWTLQREGKGVPDASLPFHRAIPSLTHMALVELEKAGILKFVISQNVDSLHLRSGIPREKLAELHGNSFRELCPSCGVEYVRDFEVETIGLKETSRHCSNEKCGARLKDTVLDWEDALPRKEMNKAEKHCKMADVVLCLGTSLQITPACNLPLKCIRRGGKIVIVNLQETPKDKKASLVIHGLVDEVIAGVFRLLNLHISPYVRIDFFQIIIKQSCISPGTLLCDSFAMCFIYLLLLLLLFFFYVSHACWCVYIVYTYGWLESETSKFYPELLKFLPMHMNQHKLQFLSFLAPCTLSATNSKRKNLNIGRNLIEQFTLDVLLPMVFCRSKVDFPERPELRSVVLQKQPFHLKREMLNTRPFKLLLKLNLSDGCGCPYIRIKVPINFELLPEDFIHEKSKVLQKLQDTAIRDLSCGQFEVVERKSTLAPRSDVAVYAMVTNIVEYDRNSRVKDIISGSNGNILKRGSDERLTETNASPKRPKGEGY